MATIRDSDDLGLSPEFADINNYDFGSERFRPIGTCVFCEEPAERLYHCHECNTDICGNCVCGTADKPVSQIALCPTCPGACCKYDAEWEATSQ